ncbi:uncharacterized protein LOC132787527 [Drosophila nasuta]|uniref:uncharacterized protein LOC132787527 n=1 Tax=Drosophila nasuta TaxID=42062 RepID=UPI00295E9C4F|nr:uncharacterized protein LOC132787527 [Drosophila nasuta]
MNTKLLILGQLLAISCFMQPTYSHTEIPLDETTTAAPTEATIQPEAQATAIPDSGLQQLDEGQIAVAQPETTIPPTEFTTVPTTAATKPSPHEHPPHPYVQPYPDAFGWQQYPRLPYNGARSPYLINSPFGSPVYPQQSQFPGFGGPLYPTPDTAATSDEKSAEKTSDKSTEKSSENEKSDEQLNSDGAFNWQQYPRLPFNVARPPYYINSPYGSPVFPPQPQFPGSRGPLSPTPDAADGKGVEKSTEKIGDKSTEKSAETAKSDEQMNSDEKQQQPAGLPSFGYPSYDPRLFHPAIYSPHLPRLGPVYGGNYGGQFEGQNETPTLPPRHPPSPRYPYLSPSRDYTVFYG